MMAGRQRLIDAARRLQPLRQGALDGLCGLYAIINALRLVILPFRPLTQTELKHLFDHGLGILARYRRLRKVLTGGIEHELWLRLGDELVFEAGQLTGLELFIEQLFDGRAPVSDPTALRAIRRQLHHGWPVMVALMDSYDHTSVIVGCSRTRLTLFDSWGYRWTRIASISFDPAKPGNPHFVPPASLVALLAY